MMKNLIIMAGLCACLFVLILFPASFAVGDMPLWKSIFGFVCTIFVASELLNRLPWGAEAEIAISLSDVVAAIKDASEDEDEKDGE